MKATLRKTLKDTNVKFYFPFQSIPSYSDIICRTHGLRNLDLDLTDEDIVDLNYKRFNKIVRPLLADVNPEANGLQVNALLAAKWREFKEERLNVSSRASSPSADTDGRKSRKSGSPSTESESRDIGSSSMVRLTCYLICVYCSFNMHSK